MSLRVKTFTRPILFACLFGIPLFYTFFKKKTPQELPVRNAITHRSFLQTQISGTDPITAVDTNTQLVVNNAYDGLINWSLSQGYQPALAERWTVGDNGKLYTFYLRQGIKFSDGSPISAQSVKAHFERLLRHKGYFQSHYDVIKNVTLEGDNVIHFHIRKPTKFLALLSGVAAKITKLNSSEHLSSGPFVVTVENPNEVVLSKNDFYWGDAPKINRIHFQVVDEDTAINLARTGGLDDLAIMAMRGTEEIPNGHFISHFAWATWIIGLDQRTKDFAEKSRREAVVLGVRSQDFIDDVFKGQTPAFGLLPFGMPGYSSRPYNIQKSGTTVHKFKFDLYVPAGLRALNNINVWLTKKLAGSPASPNILFKDFSWMVENYAVGKMPAFLLSINAEYPDPFFFVRSLHSKSSSNFLGLNNPLIDHLVDSIENENNPVVISEKMNLINEYLQEDFASVNLMHVRHTTWTRNCVRGITLHPVSEGYISYRKAENACH